MSQEKIKFIMEKVEHYGSQKVVELTLSRNDFIEDANKAEDEANVLLNEIEQDIKATLSEVETENADLNKWVNNALEALEAVKASGAIQNDDVLEMIELGLSGKPQHSNTRLG